MASVPQRPMVVICNELFDALPVHQYIKQNGAWHEKMLGINKTGNLEFMLSPCAFKPYGDDKTADGAVLEICPQANVLMETIAGRIKQSGGAALIIDYGYVKPLYKNTISALSKHKHNDLLENIGKADISAHVDFIALGKIAPKMAVEVYGPITQGEFLQNLGIQIRAEKLQKNATAQQKHDIDSALARLVGSADKQMGELFKVLAIASDGVVPEGFV
jgi:NADH dehydrogenase [ubiquinone] 1 alpha subcomplex assembly factor 7